MIDRRVLIGLVSSVSELVAVLEAFEEVPGSNMGSESQGVGRGGMGGGTTAGGGRNLAGLPSSPSWGARDGTCLVLSSLWPFGTAPLVLEANLTFCF